MKQHRHLACLCIKTLILTFLPLLLTEAVSDAAYVIEARRFAAGETVIVPAA